MSSNESAGRWTLMGGPLGRIVVSGGPSSLGIGEEVEVVPADCEWSAMVDHHMSERVKLEAEIERLRKAAEWAYQRALRIAEPAYVHPEGTVKAAEAIAKRLREALDA